MRTIIAGTRTLVDYSLVEKAIFNAECIGINITEIVSGRATGIDKLGEFYANKHNIPIKMFPAEWDRYGISAGYIRNKQMAEYADASIIIWDGISKGTKHMINLGDKYKLINYILNVKQ
jgi:hypothetical protein